MQLTQARLLAIRLTLAQNVSTYSRQKDKLIFPIAFLLASIGVGVSSFSLKQLLTKNRQLNMN